MKGADLVIEKRPILLYEDSGYALKQLLSTIKDDDNENLGNHATKAMGETGLSVPFPLFCPIVVLF